MSSSFPNGTVFSIYTAEAAVKVVSAISNASTGVATSTSHGYTDGDIVLLNMPGRLDQRVARIDNAATNAFDIEGIDTSNTILYPTGFGVGSAAEVSTPVPLSQITTTNSSGGEQQYFQWVYLEDGRQRQRPTFRNARAMQFKMDYDPTLAWHAALLAAADSSNEHVLKAALPNGSMVFWSVFVGFDGEPTFDINQNQQTTADFALASPYSTRYAS